mmetsp:Transcript_11630/g.32753  ORF Transcript_11630/g.32753 Transcript_11630/m.32753 type:complete len:207 (+) Transcript_11630:4514-5134(+)
MQPTILQTQLDMVLRTCFQHALPSVELRCLPNVPWHRPVCINLDAELLTSPFCRPLTVASTQLIHQILNFLPVRSTQQHICLIQNDIPRPLPKPVKRPLGTDDGPDARHETMERHGSRHHNVRKPFTAVFIRHILRGHVRARNPRRLKHAADNLDDLLAEHGVRTQHEQRLPSMEPRRLPNVVIDILFVEEDVVVVVSSSRGGTDL